MWVSVLGWLLAWRPPGITSRQHVLGQSAGHLRSHPRYISWVLSVACMYQGGELWTQYEVNLGGLVDVYVVIEMTVYYWCYVICCVCVA
jgi:hypothetical protein